MNQCSRNSHYTYYHNCAIILTARSSYTLRVQEGGVTSEDVSATPEVLAVRLLQWTVSSASHTTHRVYSARSAGSLTDGLYGVIVPGLIFSPLAPSLTSLRLSGSRITQISPTISEGTDTVIPLWLVWTAAQPPSPAPREHCHHVPS